MWKPLPQDHPCRGPRCLGNSPAQSSTCSSSAVLQGRVEVEASYSSSAGQAGKHFNVPRDLWNPPQLYKCRTSLLPVVPPAFSHFSSMAAETAPLSVFEGAGLGPASGDASGEDGAAATGFVHEDADEGKLPVTLLSGFLGSGKTTLLKHILSNKKGMRVAVIVNDMSEVNVDAATIKAGSVHVAHRQSEMVALESGCICCTLRQDLLEEVAKLAGEGKFDYLVIESTGMAAPAPVAETFSFGETGPGRVLGDVARLDTLVTVVDCSRFFDNMNSLESIDEDECGIGGQPGSLVSLLIEQVEFATTILLNKTDLVSPDELETVAAFVKKLNPGATVLRCTNSAVPLDSVLNTKAYSLDCAALMPGWLMELQGDAAQEKEDQEAPAAPTDGPDAPADCCAAGTCASEAPSTGAARPFHPQRLHGALDVLFAPDSVASIVASGGADDGSLGVVLRSKGSLWLASAHDTM
ncbi:unnamed protein product, partial [Symbiodinium sp. KB8]